MPRIKDMTGYISGKLTALEICGRDKWGAVIWKCQCECGNICVMSQGMLANGRNKSCGELFRV